MGKQNNLLKEVTKMDLSLKSRITITVNSEEEKMRIGTAIHKQLKGNKDYVDCNIILNIDASKTIELLIFKECEIVPEIKINI